MRSFDTNVQLLKYRVLKEVSNCAFEDNMPNGLLKIPEIIVPGPEATMRCCIYKERAIVNERVRMVMGGDKNNENVIEVIGIACDECPANHYAVGPDCRGCIAHWCQNTCPKDAIDIVNQKAHIDPNKCIGCGKCAGVCPYSAITKRTRPCEQACKVNAISADEQDKKAVINYDKCISCGACVYRCPFGAIVDKSYILDAIRMLRESENNTKYKVYAIIAPAISSQFTYAKIGQVVAGIKHLGFYNVIEAALGADMVAYKESQELREKGFLTTSCCPAFVAYIEKNYPQLADNISHNRSPMAEIGWFIKQMDPTAKVIFIGPCTAKKMEQKKEGVKEYVDCVITFEELQALLDSREIKIEDMEEDVLDNASYFGRIFARSSGVTDAVRQALKEQNITEQDFQFNPISCDGIEDCKLALLKKSKGVLKENFIEGMACVGGCIGGAASLSHGAKDKNEVNKYGDLAKEKSISDAISVLDLLPKKS